MKKYCKPPRPIGDSCRDLFIPDGWRSLRLRRGHVFTIPKNGRQQNCQVEVANRNCPNCSRMMVSNYVKLGTMQKKQEEEEEEEEEEEQQQQPSF